MIEPAPGTGHVAAPELDRYVAIERFAELELKLAGRGELDSLESHAASWDALIAGLPECPPPSAQPLLERAMLMHDRACIELLRMRELLLADLDTVGHVARAARGYAPAAPRRLHLDRNA